MVKKPEDGEGLEARWAAIGVDITEEMRKAEGRVKTNMEALTAMLKAEYDRGVKDGIEKGRSMADNRMWVRAKAEGLVDPSEVD